jgi:hypothetical protein
MNLDERESGLLALIEGYRDAECRALLDAARAEAAALLARTWRAERARLHARVVAERAAAQARIQAARAEQDTCTRALVEQANARLLADAWPRLCERLRARWSSADDRRDWARGALTQAQRVLPAGAWTLRHAPGWEEAERRPLTAGLAAALGHEPRCIADPRLAAGLVIERGTAQLDASLAGLLADRARLEARLLGLLAVGTAGPGP